jgi:hypothetical protein
MCCNILVILGNKRLNNKTHKCLVKTFFIDERSILVGIGNCGAQIGVSIAFPLGSYLCLNG